MPTTLLLASDRRSRALRGLAVGITVLVAAASTPAQAGPVSWTNWTSFDNVSVQGSIVVDGSTISVTYTGERGFVQTACGTDYWIQSPAGPNPYTSPTVDNPPNGSSDPLLRCDIIALSHATAKLLEFSEPVTNPLFAVVSLNGNGYRFDRDFEILSFAQGYWGDGTLTKRISTSTTGAVTYDLIGTGEPHGVIQFIGTFSTVHWDSLSDEYWNGFSIAVEHLAVNVPPEIEVFAQGSALTDGQTTPVDFGELDARTSSTIELTIVNSGTGPLNIAAITVSGPDSSAFSVGSVVPAIAAQGSTIVTLTFTTSVSATYTASVTIESDDADEGEFTFPVTGAARVDTDGDGVIDLDDNCPAVPNVDQEDTNLDGQGDACDTDDDGDGAPDTQDNCPLVSNTDQLDTDGDQAGDACDPDRDGDGIADTGDNCVSDVNADQADLDDDGIGDVCDPDADGDGTVKANDCNDLDASVASEATAYADPDGDLLGDLAMPRAFCAATPPEGYVTQAPDNCPTTSNADQADGDGDGVGTACDNEGSGPGGENNDGDGCGCRASAPRSDRAPFLAALLALMAVSALRRRR